MGGPRGTRGPRCPQAQRPERTNIFLYFCPEWSQQSALCNVLFQGQQILRKSLTFLNLNPHRTEVFRPNIFCSLLPRISLPSSRALPIGALKTIERYYTVYSDTIHTQVNILMQCSAIRWLEFAYMMDSPSLFVNASGLQGKTSDSMS